MARREVALLITLVAAAAATASATPIQAVPQVMQVAVQKFTVDGAAVVPNAAPCTGQTFGTPCLLKLAADRDTVTATYSYNGTVNSTTAPVSVTAFLCYSPWSQIGRPWRAASANRSIETDRSCYPKHQKKGLAAAGGTFTLGPTPDWPGSTVYLRVLAMCKNSTGGMFACGRGRSPGFFQVTKIDSRTSTVKGAAAAVMVGGLVLVVGAVFLDNWMTKNNKRP